MNRRQPPESRQARIYLSRDRVLCFEDQRLAYAVWLALPKGVRAAFRGLHDHRRVYSWDYVDRP